MKGPREREVEVCERFFSLTASGRRDAEFERLLQEIYPLVCRAVRNQCWRGMLQGAARDWEDVAHDVYLRLQENPPCRKPHLNARVSFLAWIKTTTGNYLKDLRRKTPPGRHIPFEETPRPDGKGIGLTGAGFCDGTRSPEEDLATRSELDSVADFLRETYPKGARYVELQRANPDASVAEIARAMGVSRANVDKIKQRTKQYVKEYIVRQRNGITSGKKKSRRT